MALQEIPIFHLFVMFISETTSCCNQIRVTGSGNEQWYGDYTINGNINGKTSYKKGPFEIIWYIYEWRVRTMYIIE